MPDDPRRDNPFAPPEAPLGPPEPEPEPSAGPSGSYDGPDVMALFARWELARWSYNGVLGLVAYGIWSLEVGTPPRDTSLFIEAVLINLAFCIGPVLTAAGTAGHQAAPLAAPLLCAVGVVLTLVTVGYPA